MKKAISNAYFGSSNITPSGTIIDGSATDLTDTDFSFKVVFGGSTGTINVAATGAYSEYLGIHGIFTPNFGTVRVRVLSGASEVFNEVISGNSLVIPRTSSNATWTIQLSEYVGLVSISYVAAGFLTEVPRNGLRGGQLLPYDGLNLETAFRINQLAQPTNVVYRNKAPTDSFTIPDAPNSWIDGDYQQILSLYRLTGIVSVLDDDNDPKRSYAGYDMTSQVRTHPSTLSVRNVNFTYKVAQ